MSTESNIAGVNAAGIGVNNQVTPGKPIAYSCVCTTANSTYTDTPTGAVELVPAQSLGARITKVTALMRITKSATECQLFTSKDSGSTKKFVDSTLMNGYSVAQTTKQNKADFLFTEANPLILAAGENLYAAIGVGSGDVVFRAEGGAYV